MKNYLKEQYGMIDVVLILVVSVAVAALGGYVYYQQRQAQNGYDKAGTGVTVSKHTKAKKAAADPYAGWKTYNSTAEKASFKYPSSWKATKAFDLNVPGADSFAITSPKGQITIGWLSAISGIGGGCDDALAVDKGGCPEITVVSKQTIRGAAGLDVVSVVVTSDGQNYQPWIGVMADTIKSSRELTYSTFMGRNNKSLPNSGGENLLVSFGTANGIYMVGPKLSKASANTWFAGPEQQQAKLIFGSLTY